MALVTDTNLDYLITEVRMQVGDLTEDTFGDDIIKTALVSAVKYLAGRWGNRYLIYDSDMLVSGTTVKTPDGQCTLSELPASENYVFRNCHHTFLTESPPVIEQNDEFPIIIAASMFLRRSVITSSMTAFTNWSTPDLSYSNVASHRSIQDSINHDMATLDLFFRKRLGKSVKQSLTKLR